MLGKIAIEEIDRKKDKIIDLSLKIWNNPEGPLEEYKARDWTKTLLEDEGFHVDVSPNGITTAIKASWGNGKPEIGFLGEYDALPSLSQDVTTTKKSIPNQYFGHGCGHNLICAGSVAAAIGMKKEMEEKNLDGTVVFYGCPAEEILIGKPLMADAGLFDNLDAAIAFHPMFQNEVSLGNLQAMYSVKFHFNGITSHAATDPQNGRSSHDAAELMSAGANYLREHVTDDIRIHYAFTETGAVPNIIPDKTTVWYFIRGKNKNSVEEVYYRLIKVAKGAAIMTETDVQVEILGGCHETMQNEILANLIHKNMEKIPMEIYTNEDIEFARKLNETNMDLTNKQRIKALDTKNSEIHMEVPPIGNAINFGSTDVGDVAHIVPTIFFTTACYNIGAAGHSWHVTASSGHNIGQKGMLYGAKIMAKTGLELLENQELLLKAKEEFNKSMENQVYTPILNKNL